MDRSVLRSVAGPGLTALVIFSGAVATSVASGFAAALVMVSLLAGCLGLLAGLVHRNAHDGQHRRERRPDLAAEWATVEPEWSGRRLDGGPGA